MKWIDMHCDTLSEIIRQRKELKRNDLCADLERLLRGKIDKGTGEWLNTGNQTES